MKSRNILILILLFICNVQVLMSQSSDNEPKYHYLSLISHIDDSSLDGCICWLDAHPYSSVIPCHWLGIKYAIYIESSIDSSFSECSTISKNDSLFVLNEEDMKNIKRLYEEWFYLWQKDKSTTKRAMDGTKYKWVKLDDVW